MFHQAAAPEMLPIAITMGDPAGCGPQISHSAMSAAADITTRPVFAIGSPEVFAEFGDIDVISEPADAARSRPNRLAVLPVDRPLEAAVRPGFGDPANAQATIRAIEMGVALSLSNKVAGLVTNPINKSILYTAGFSYPGHTEFLAALSSPAKALKPVMMLVGGGLHVALATIHTALRNVPDLLTIESLVEIGQITHTAMQQRFGIEKPRLAFSGLNPHAGENGSLGQEELEIINPAADKLRQSGIDISDARSADTLFAETLAGSFDAIIAMTHDQGLIPVKTLDFWGGVNVTLGLPLIRTSPDHGTAYDAAASGSVRPDSLIAAIRLASDMAAKSASAPSDHD